MSLERAKTLFPKKWATTQHDQAREVSPQEEAKEGLNTTSQTSESNQSLKSLGVTKSKLVPLDKGERLNITSKTHNLSPSHIPANTLKEPPPSTRAQKIQNFAPNNLDPKFLPQKVQNFSPLLTNGLIKPQTRVETKTPSPLTKESPLEKM
jgi:hypothetical protein